jgi:hypothetical protein
MQAAHFVISVLPAIVSFHKQKKDEDCYHLPRFPTNPTQFYQQAGNLHTASISSRYAFK